MPDQDVEKSVKPETEETEEDSGRLTIPVPESMRSEDEEGGEAKKVAKGEDLAVDKGDDEPGGWEISAGLAERARRLGVDSAQLEEFSTEADAFQALIDLSIERSKSDGTKATEKTIGEDGEAFQLPKLEFGEDADPQVVKGVTELREATQKQFDAIDKRHKEQMDAVHLQLQDAQRVSAKSDQERFAGDYDKWLDNAPGYKDKLGDGSVFDLKPGTREYRNADRLITAFTNIRNDSTRSGQDIPNDRLLSAAAMLVFGDPSNGTPVAKGSRRGVGRPSRTSTSSEGRSDAAKKQRYDDAYAKVFPADED